MSKKELNVRDLAKDAAYLIVICGEIRGIALKHVGCTDENVDLVDNLLDTEIEFLRFH